jgi:hypothetical protein
LPVKRELPYGASGLHGALDRALLGSCVSCGSHVQRWSDRLDQDPWAVVRVGIDSRGQPVLMATYCDACNVCGAPEIRIEVVGTARRFHHADT